MAVVPFVDLAGDAASRRLGEAFYEYCTHDLSWFREFQMVLRGPTFVYRDQAERGLPVDYVLGGTVDRQGDRLRLTAELTNGRTGEVVWSERWDRPERDVEAMREEIAQAIGSRLGGATGVIQEAGRAAARAKPPHERTPWDLLLLGSGQLALGTRAGAARSRGAARRGGVARSGAGACRGAARPRASAPCRVRRRPGGQPAHRPRRRGEAEFLDAGDAWGYAALGAIRRHEGDLVRARAEYDTALNLTPNAAEIMTLFAGWAATAGEPERGAALADRVARLDPDFPPSRPRSSPAPTSWPAATVRRRR